MTKHKPDIDWPTRRAPKAEREAFAKERFARAPIAMALFLGDPQPLIDKMKKKGIKLRSVTEVLRHMIGARQPGPREKIKRVRLPLPLNVTKAQLQAARDKNIALRQAWRARTDTKKVEPDRGDDIRRKVMLEFGIPPWGVSYLKNAERRKKKPRKKKPRKKKPRK